MAVNYENTYWNRKGKHQENENKILHSLIPASGSVKEADKNPALETYRIASNCYYDLYNNGLCNRREEFERVFEFIPGTHDGLDQDTIDRTETRMDEIILAAYAEQFSETKQIQGTLVDEHAAHGNTVTIDLTPAGCQTPEGTKRVEKSMREWEDTGLEVACALELMLGAYPEHFEDLESGAAGEDARQDWKELLKLIATRKVKQEAFLKAVAGIPEVGKED